MPKSTSNPVYAGDAGGKGDEFHAQDVEMGHVQEGKSREQPKELLSHVPHDKQVHVSLDDVSSVLLSLKEECSNCRIRLKIAVSVCLSVWSRLAFLLVVAPTPPFCSSAPAAPGLCICARPRDARYEGGGRGSQRAASALQLLRGCRARCGVPLYTRNMRALWNVKASRASMLLVWPPKKFCDTQLRSPDTHFWHHSQVKCLLSWGLQVQVSRVSSKWVLSGWHKEAATATWVNTGARAHTHTHTHAHTHTHTHTHKHTHTHTHKSHTFRHRQEHPIIRVGRP